VLGEQEVRQQRRLPGFGVRGKMIEVIELLLEY
jgi:hypothetical protein